MSFPHCSHVTTVFARNRFLTNTAFIRFLLRLVHPPLSACVFQINLNPCDRDSRMQSMFTTEPHVGSPSFPETPQSSKLFQSLVAHWTSMVKLHQFLYPMTYTEAMFPCPFTGEGCGLQHEARVRLKLTRVNLTLNSFATLPISSYSRGCSKTGKFWQWKAEKVKMQYSIQYDHY